MTQTTAIGGLGLAVFAFSTFTPTQRFGALMLALLVAALVGDLIFCQHSWPVGNSDGYSTKKKGDKAGPDPSVNPSSVDINPPTTAPYPPGHISMSAKRQSPKPDLK